MKKNIVFLMSLIFALMMILGAQGLASALADDQQQKGDYYIASQTDGAKTEQKVEEDHSAVLRDNGSVSVKKTIEETDTENVFDVTLRVETNQSISTISKTPDAAVVLVFDASASMNENDDDRKTRMDEAREAAQAFLEEYAAVPSNVRRMVSVVAFWKDAYIIQDWVDIKNVNEANDGYYSFLNSTPLTSQLTSHSGTNIEAGLLLAENLIQEEFSGNSPVINGITNRHVVLLSDGASNSNVVGSEDVKNYVQFYGSTTDPILYYKDKDGSDAMYGASDDDKKNYEENTVLFQIQNEQISSLVSQNDVLYGMYNNADYHFHHKDPVNIAQRIRSYIGPNRDVKVQMHSIYCGSTSETLSNTADTSLSGNTDRAKAIRQQMATYKCKYCDAALYDIQHGTKSTNNDVRTYLADLSDSYATTSGIDALKTAFSAIQETIRLDVSAWQTTDMLGDGYDFVEFRGSYANGEVSLLPQGDGLNWDLKKAADKGAGSKHIYELEYRVKLDTFDSAFTANTLYPSNEWADLRYYIIENDVASPTKTVYYNHPSAKGFMGNLSFTKVNQYNDSLQDAAFRLVSAEKDANGNPLWISGTEVSDQNGQVSFTNIPSGHDYVLEETTVPANHHLSDKKYEVRVSYGTATLYEDDVVSADRQVENASETVYTTKLKVSKQVVNGDPNKQFAFLVQLTGPDGQPITEDLDVLDANGQSTGQTAPYNNGGYHLSLKHNQFVTLDGIELGSSYVITETDYTSDGYTAAGSLVREGRITSTNGASVEYINTLHKKLTIEKALEGDAANENDAFNFHFRLLDAQGNAITGAVLSAKTTEENPNVVAVTEQTGAHAGWYAVSITGSGEVEISGIPGNCTKVLMHERDLGFGYEASYADAAGNVLSPDSLVSDSYAVSYGSALTAGYRVTNTRERGSLEISKEITSVVPGDESKVFNFEITVTEPSDFADETRTLNAYKNGEATVVTFVDGKATIALGHQDRMRIEGFIDETEYTVTEAARSGFETTITKTVGTGNPQVTKDTAAVSGEIVAGSPTKIHYENESTAGALIVKKSLESEYPPDASKQFSFVVTIANQSLDLNGEHTFGGVKFVDGVAVFQLRNEESRAITGLPAGTSYSVVEGEYEARSVIHPYTNEFEVIYTGEQNGTIEANTQKTVLVTNKRKTGKLIVKKSVVSSDADDKKKEFTFTVELSDTGANHNHSGVQFTNGVATFKLKDGETKTIDHLPVGMGYTITESGDGVDHFTTVITGATGDQAHDEDRQITGVLATGDNTILYSNEHVNAGLAISKSVQSPSGADDNQEFNFHLTIVDENGSTKTSVSDTFNTVHVGVPVNGTSQRKEGSIRFDQGVALQPVTLKRGESFYILLPAHTHVRIVEDEVVKNGLTIFENKETTVETGSNPNTPVLAEFNNVRKTGELKVSKTVDSAYDADQTRLYQFTVTLDDSTVSGPFGDMTFENGVATFTLQNGNHKIAAGLPQGVNYTVTEAAVTGIETTMTGDNGMITGTQAHAAFTNTRRVQAGLRIRKTVESGNELDKNKSFTVTVEIPELNHLFGDDTKQYGEITFTNGRATLTVRDGTTFAARLLPEGAKFTVTETEAEGFTTTVASGLEGSVGQAVSGHSVQGELVNGQIVEVVFNNKRTSTADLKISKSVVSPYSTDKEPTPGMNDATPYTFTIDLQQDINGTFELVGGSEGSITFNGGIANLTIHGEGSRTIKGLTTGIQYRVTEQKLPGFTVNPQEATGEIPLSGEAEAVFANTRLTSDLIVLKTVDSVLSDDKNIGFPFTVKLSDSRINGTFRTYTNGSSEYDPEGLTFTNGEATFTLKHGESKRIAYLPVGVGYTVTEAANARFTVTKTGDTGTITENATQTASFINTNTHGGLVVMKKVVSTFANDSANDSGPGREYHMLVKLGSPLNGTYGDVTFTNGEAAFTLQDNKYKVISGLPAGVEYSVMEGAYVDGSFQGYTHEFDVEYLENQNIQNTDLTNPNVWMSGDGQDVIVANGWKGVAVRNTRKYGGFTIKKLVVSDREDDDKKQFSFDVKMLRPADRTVVKEINGTYGDVTFTNGEATVTLKHNETKTVSGMPVGLLYSIHENLAQNDGFLVTIVGAQNDTVNSNTNTITGPVLPPESPNAAPSVITFSNEHEKGSLAITKNVQILSVYDNERDFVFHIELLKDNNVDTSIQNKSYSYNKVKLDESPLQPGTLTVTNGVSNTFTLRAGETIYFTNLPAGKVRIVESEVVQNEITIFEGQEQIVEITGGENAQTQTVAKFTNVRETGRLMVSKNVVSPYNSDKAKKFRFRVTLLRTTQSGDVTAVGLSGKFGDMGFVAGVAEFDLEHDMTRVATGLPAGVKYRVEELLSEEEKTNSIYTVAPTGAIAEGVIQRETNLPNGQTVTPEHVAFTNTRNVQAGLRVVKNVVSDNPQDKQKVFNVRVTMHDEAGNPLTGTYGQMTFTNGVAMLEVMDGSSYAAWGLPVGSVFTVDEEEADGFVAQAVTTEVGYTPAADVRLRGSGNAQESDQIINHYKVKVVTITNTREKGSLTVSKQVESPMASDEAKEFSFTVQLDPAIGPKTYGGMTFDKDGRASFTLKDGESITADNLPTGVRYTVTETADSGFSTAYTNPTGMITTEGASAAVVNTRRNGELVITKEVVSRVPSDQTMAFDVKLTLKDETGSPIVGNFGGHAFDANGETTFTIRHGESVRITGLPIGARYTVVEADYPLFDTAYTGESGTIAEKTQAAIVNTRKTASADDALEIKKTVISPLKSDGTKVFTFDVTLSDPTVVGEYNVTYGSGAQGRIDFVQGKAIVCLCGGESVRILNLPLGVTCKVSERAENGFAAELNGEEQRVLEADGLCYEFTNTRETKGSLTVSKTVTGSASSTEDVFTFQVRMPDLVDGIYGGTAFKDGAAELKLKHGESVVITGIPADTAWEAAETDYGNYTPVQTLISGTTTENGDVAAFVNVLEYPEDLPQTGDESHLIFWALALGVCCAGAFVLHAEKRKNE